MGACVKTQIALAVDAVQFIDRQVNDTPWWPAKVLAGFQVSREDRS